MDWDFELLRKLCETPGAPGREERIRSVAKSHLEALCDEVTVDPIGNVIGLRRGVIGKRRGPTPGDEPRRLMLSSHIDELGFMVTHVDNGGFIRFVPLGSYDPKTLTAQRVIVHGRRDILGVLGTKPIHLMTEEERRVAPKLEDYFVDIGLPAPEARELVSTGDVITRDRDVREMGDTVTGKSFDNRMGVFVMLQALERTPEHEVDVYAVASVQEEVGVRGAVVATRRVDPHVGIALDVTLANDVPDTKPHEHVTKLGHGAAIKVMDSSVLCHPGVVAHLREVAEQGDIPVQLEVLPRGGTDTAALQRSGSGAAVGCVSIPTRYVHSVIEVCHKSDIEAAIALLSGFITSAHKPSFAL